MSEELQKDKWYPIDQLVDKYIQPIRIASPYLIDGDCNVLGIADAYWQDTEGPEQGEWRYADFDMCNDEFSTGTLQHKAVTHFQLPSGPYTPEELDSLERTDD